ncbi:hypothetical protein [Bacillus badius]|uniref:Mercury resistance protein n=1 Tax=Bacillus badius TaxID=1455 RepID=A0ABR5ANM4_BACBA|nr:hypothetical protein [Bacillus badius]KIL72276.1 putative mercury resistance protein [Bacillus badius]KZN99244.1 hypothetical protein A4244_19470 [Bacillus badius]KZR57854.1 hypothetical protein A3781_19490 [Bacillus badius]MED0668478.1 hypothetical protein [Bacillus badius]MED4717544.1 hypothetical protein [Bacillus badius]
MTDKWFTVAEIEKETGIPDATVRRYIRNHGHNFQLKKKGKSYLVTSESVEIMKQIREWYAGGKQAEQVEENLAKAGIPMTVTVTDEEEVVTVNVAETLQDMKKSMAEMNEKYDELMKAFKLQQEYIDQKLEARDQKLMEALNHSLEIRKELASGKQEEEKKKGFWARLFGS